MESYGYDITILNKAFIENYTNLDNYLYCSILDIKKLHIFLENVLKKTKVVNLYNNKVDRE